MKSKLTKAEREAEAKFAKDIYKNRGEVVRDFERILNERAAAKAEGRPITAGVRPAALLAKVEAAVGGSRPVSIRLDVRDIERAEKQAAAKGLKYQTYIKMLLHEALAARAGELTLRR